MSHLISDMDWDAPTDSGEGSDFLSDEAEGLSDGETSGGETSEGELWEEEPHQEENRASPVQVDAEGNANFEKLRHAPATKAPTQDNSADSTPPRRRQLFAGNAQPAEYYRRTIATFDRAVYLRSRYAPKTTKALDRVLDEWCEFSRVVLDRPWEAAMRRLNLGTIKSFVQWHLGQLRSKDGRRRRGTAMATSLQTFWNTFRLVYRREMLAEIDHKLERSAAVNVIAEFKEGLSKERRDNRPMTLDDLKLQIETTLSTTEKNFKLGEQRVLAVLFLLLLAPAGSRPDSILKLQYKHIQIALHQPREGPAQLVIYVRLEFTKGYRGTKDIKTFIVPEVLYDPSLFLSPHVFLLAILCKRKAFAVEKINEDPGLFAKFAMRGVGHKEKQMLFPLKAATGEDYVFRALQPTPTGFELSDKGMSYSTMNSTLKRISSILGFETNATSYHLRYNAGNNMNQSISISNSLQNLVMDHAPNSDVFQRNYLNRNVTFDLWALQRGLEPQQDLVREAASFGLRRSERRPLGLTPAQAAALKDDPEYVELASYQASLDKRSAEYVDVKKELKAMLERLRYAAIKKNTGKEWTEAQAIRDIEQQIGGLAVSAAPESITRRRNKRPMSPAQEGMVNALYQSMNEVSLEGQYQRRTAAIVAIMRYCIVQEPLVTPVLQDRPARVPALQLLPASASRHAEEQRLRQLVTVKADGQRIVLCFLCVGAALKLPPGDPNMQGLCRDYCNPSAVARHFRSAHLKFISPDRPPPCPICPGVTFSRPVHFQNHAQLVHGIVAFPAPRPRTIRP